MSVGLLEGLLSTIGDSDTEIGGLYSTRLTAAVAPGTTILPVETTLDWDDAGRLALDGVVYYYTGKTATTFTGITHRDGTTSLPGTYKQHRDASEVTDLNRSRNAMDQVRRSMLVAYAEDENLTSLARDLGVPRFPLAAMDDAFREVVRGLAYNPRGTMYGLELLLDGLAGAGNYEILEDLIQYPCTVFIKLKGSATATLVSAGKSYLSDGAPLLADSETRVTLPADPAPLTVESVKLADVDHSFDLTTPFLPSEMSVVEYPGDSRQAWTYDGTATEATHVLPTDGEPTFFQDAAGQSVFYRRPLRITPESRAQWGMLFALDSGGSPHLTDAKHWAMRVDDGERILAFGVLGANASSAWVGFVTWISGTFLLSPVVVINETEFHDVRMVKNGRKNVELWVDGKRVQTLPYSSFALCTPSDSHQATFGMHDTDASTYSGYLVKRVSLYVENPTDYWAARDAAGSLSSEVVLDASLAAFVASDDGREVRLYNGTATNAQGGNNNGKWRVRDVNSPTQAELMGPDFVPGASVNAAHPKRIVVPDPNAFTFPNHRGHYIRLTGSGAGNNGTYVIEKILDPDTLVDMGSWRSHQEARSNVCEVVAASFATEVNLSWRLAPKFINETPIAWEMGGGGDVSGMPTIELPVPGLPFNPAVDDDDLIVKVKYTTVLSAQVVEDYLTRNAVEDEGPPVLYDRYPFYLSDPLAYIRSYLDVATAAGIIPDYALV